MSEPEPDLEPSRPRGRPPLPFTPEEAESLLTLVRAGASVRQVTIKACVSRTRLARNLEDDPDFRLAFERAEADGKSADVSKNPETKPLEVPAFMASLPAPKIGRPAQSFDDLNKETFLELIRNGFRRFSACRVLNLSARALKNVSFRRECRKGVGPVDRIRRP